MSAPVAARETLVLAVDGRERRAVLAAPPAPAGPLSLVLMLHGAGATAAMAESQTGWSALAAREGFAVAYPEGTARDPAAPPLFRLNPQAWNDGSGRGHVARAGIDDVSFLGALIDRVAERLPVDRTRVFAAGFSNGASMAYRLGVALGARLRGIAAIAGHCWVEGPPAGGTPSLLAMVGDADPLSPLEGGTVTTPWGHAATHPAPRASAARWAGWAGCPEPPVAQDGPAASRIVAWRDGVGGARVEFWTVPAMGHVWPGGPRLLPARLVGPAFAGFQGAEIAWDFFRRLPG